MSGPADERVAVVLVTFNRADLLAQALHALAGQTRVPDAVLVVDNASTDHTGQVLAAATNPGLQVIRMAENTGGAGGFHAGLGAAHEQGFDRIWLTDDDVVAAPDCLATLLAHDEDCLMVVREDRRGALVEKSAVRFDLRNPLHLKPKTSSVETTYGRREAMPELVEVEVVAFEGLLVRRRVVDAVGLPDPAFFIFYDDADFTIRARRAGFRIWCVRDAVVTRLLDFDQQHALDSWKGFFMFRNLFVVHLRHGENALVRAKPWAITAGVLALSPLRGGRAEARNVWKALRSARTMRTPPAAAHRAAAPAPPRGDPGDPAPRR